MKNVQKYMRCVNRSDNEKKSYIKRLNRIEGQLHGVARMIDENRPCEDVFIQLAAIKSGVEILGCKLIINQMKDSISNEFDNNSKTDLMNEFIILCKRVMR